MLHWECSRCHSLLPELLVCGEHLCVSPSLDSAEGSDLARCRLLPNWFVLFLPCRSSGGHRTDGERTRALYSSGRWDVQGCFFHWKMHILFFTNVGELCHETGNYPSFSRRKIASDLPKTQKEQLESILS